MNFFSAARFSLSNVRLYFSSFASEFRSGWKSGARVELRASTLINDVRGMWQQSQEERLRC